MVVVAPLRAGGRIGSPIWEDNAYSAVVRGTMKRCWMFGAVLSLFVCSSVAAQQNPKQLLAKKHYELGAQLYKTSNYRQALVEFTKAYQLAKKPGLLFNIARCHEVMANLEQAVKYYRVFLAQVPTAPNRSLVETRLANLEKVLAERNAKKEKPTPPPEPKKPPPEPKKMPVESAPVPVTPAPKPESVVQATPASVNDARPLRWKRTAGWIALGTGGALLVTGIVFGAMASGKASDYEEAAKEQYYKNLGELRDEGESLESTQIGLMVAGGVLAAAGGGLLLWHYLGRKNNRVDSTALVVPLMTDNAVGLMGQLRF